MTHTPQPGARYIVQGRLKHGRSGGEAPHPGESAGEFQHGDDFFSDDPKLLTQLHDAGAIRLPSEVEEPEVIAARERGLAAENEALKAELAKLKDAASAAPKSGRGKAAAAAEAKVEAELEANSEEEAAVEEEADTAE